MENNRNSEGNRDSRMGCTNPNAIDRYRPCSDNPPGRKEENAAGRPDQAAVARDQVSAVQQKDEERIETLRQQLRADQESDKEMWRMRGREWALQMATPRMLRRIACYRNGAGRSLRGVNELAMFVSTSNMEETCPPFEFVFGNFLEVNCYCPNEQLRGFVHGASEIWDAVRYRKANDVLAVAAAPQLPWCGWHRHLGCPWMVITDGLTEAEVEKKLLQMKGGLTMALPIGQHPDEVQ